MTLTKNFLYLDVDGVLGNAHTKGLRSGMAWLDDENIATFKEILRQSEEKYGEITIILTSSWRTTSFHGSGMRDILDERLAKEDIFVDDEVPNLDEWSRGYEIAQHLLAHKDEAERYIVLDDVVYKDFKPLGITKHLVQTADDPRNGAGGLRKRHIKAAMRMLEKPMTEKEWEMLRRELGKVEQGYL